MEKNESMYRCPICSSTELEVIDCRVIGHMELTDDGFIPEGDTTDEIVLCKVCSHKDNINKFQEATS